MSGLLFVICQVIRLLQSRDFFFPRGFFSSFIASVHVSRLLRESSLRLLAVLSAVFVRCMGNSFFACPLKIGPWSRFMVLLEVGQRPVNIDPSRSTKLFIFVTINLLIAYDENNFCLAGQRN